MTTQSNSSSSTVTEAENNSKIVSSSSMSSVSSNNGEIKKTVTSSSNQYPQDTNDSNSKIIKFDQGDFLKAFPDAKSEKNGKIKISSLPKNGILKLGTNQVKLGQEIEIIALASLVLIPNANFSGKNDSFTWVAVNGHKSDTSNVSLNSDSTVVEEKTIDSKNQPLVVEVLTNAPSTTNSLELVNDDRTVIVENIAQPSFGVAPLGENTFSTDLIINNKTSVTETTSENATQTVKEEEVFTTTVTLTPPIKMMGSDIHDDFSGTLEANIIDGKNGQDNLFGLDGDDTIYGGNQNDRLHGGHNNDLLDGGKGNDTLKGENDNDTLIGGEGKDSLTGGEGKDLFVYQKLADKGDVITDFNVTEDRLVLRELFTNIDYQGTNPIDEGYLRFLQTGTNTEVQIDANGPNHQEGFFTLVVMENITTNTLILGQNVIF